MKEDLNSWLKSSPEPAEGWLTVASQSVSCRTNLYLYKRVTIWAKNLLDTERTFVYSSAPPEQLLHSSFTITKSLCVCHSDFHSDTRSHTDIPHFLFVLTKSRCLSLSTPFLPSIGKRQEGLGSLPHSEFRLCAGGRPSPCRSKLWKCFAASEARLTAAQLTARVFLLNLNNDDARWKTSGLEAF